MEGWNWPNNSATGLNNFFNQTSQYQRLPHYEIVKVNGEAGARAFQMAPNSSLFLADATNPNLIWLVQTDGAGYLTPTPLDVCLHQTQPQVNVNDLENRVKELETKYEQLNSGFGKQSKKQRQSSEQPTDSAT